MAMRDSEVYTNRGAVLRVDDDASLRSSTVSFVEPDQGFVTPLALSLTSLFRSQTQGFGCVFLVCLLPSSGKCFRIVFLHLVGN
ncbi:hypothetical protein QR680_016994 [Steinernema hermaphroditum]|uniref:Uncharacterized protein n=1 Tax=Steinernema hermaphroditum TaxID=289476 RepID=A0AA39LN82_9BILA|nr:hypothetical protein QR680_016994 [Steinernema hermaphroditum]